MPAFSRAGSGPPLVLLHGTNSSRAIWNPLLSRLAVERDVIAFDPASAGASPATSLTPPASPLSWPRAWISLACEPPRSSGTP